MEVTLTVAQVQRYEVVLAAIEGRMTNAEAASALGRSIPPGPAAEAPGGGRLACEE